MSLRAERLRRRMAQAAGARVDGADPGLSPAPAVRDPELTNRFAIAGIIVGIGAVFVSGFYVLPALGLVFGALGLHRSRVLVARGKAAFGRRRSLWAMGLGLFGVAQYSYLLFVAPLF